MKGVHWVLLSVAWLRFGETYQGRGPSDRLLALLNFFAGFKFEEKGNDHRLQA